MNTRGFTLIEILLTFVITATVMLAIYGTFQRAVHARDGALDRTREARLRLRADQMIRDDLNSIFLSGGRFASLTEGSEKNPKSRFPGYLRFSTTTGVNRPEALADVQCVEYYVIDSEDPEADTETGVLVRAVTRDLMEYPDADEQIILTRVREFTVTFYDGEEWQDVWSNGTMPRAVKVRIQQNEDDPPLEIFTSPVSQPNPTQGGSR